MPKRIDWTKTAAEWADEVAWLEAHGDVHSREYREAAANLRTALRHVETEQDKQEERDRHNTMPVKEIVDRMTEY